MGARPRILIGLLLTAGILVLSYPTISNWLATRNHSQAIVEYSLTVQELAEEEIKEQFARANAYNASLNTHDIGDAFSPTSGAAPSDEYLSTLNIGGMIGYLDIPSIHVHLPIYHTTSSTVLKKGVGHLSSSAFPVGGKSTHSVLTAHRGLPSAKLFSDLDELEPGDMFYINVLDQILGYQVDQVLVVDPNDTEALQPVREQDYLTLITCTPYAINSHRLLVRGNRVPLEEEHVVTLPSLNQHPSESLMRTSVVLPAFAYSGATLATGMRIRSVKSKRAKAKIKKRK